MTARAQAYMLGAQLQTSSVWKPQDIALACPSPAATRDCLRLKKPSSVPCDARLGILQGRVIRSPCKHCAKETAAGKVLNMQIGEAQLTKRHTAALAPDVEITTAFLLWL